MGYQRIERINYFRVTINSLFTNTVGGRLSNVSCRQPILLSKMSKNDRLITYAYKKTKNSQENNRNIMKETDGQPSSSKSTFQSDMEILRKFDLHLEFGPAVGITRLERWRRANKHGLDPSLEVKDLIEAHCEDERYTQSLWNDYKNLI